MMTPCHRTRDGKIIKPGMVLFFSGDAKSFLCHCEKVARVDRTGVYSDYVGTMFLGGKMPVEIAYSSMQAAIQTKGNN